MSKSNSTTQRLDGNGRPFDSASEAVDLPFDSPESSEATAGVTGQSGESGEQSDQPGNDKSTIDELDPFDPANLARMRLSQDFASMADVKPQITTVAVRKPHKHEFVRVRPGAEWRFETGCFIDKETRETYLVTPQLWPAMPGEIQATVLQVTVSRNSPVPFLWPCCLPGPDGRPNRWHESTLQAACMAESQWLRVVSDMSAGCYVPFVAAGNFPDPEWPALTLAELLKLAFRDRFIQDMNHPVLQRLRGEI